MFDGNLVNCFLIESGVNGVFKIDDGIDFVSNFLFDCFKTASKTCPKIGFFKLAVDFFNFGTSIVPFCGSDFLILLRSAVDGTGVVDFPDGFRVVVGCFDGLPLPESNGNMIL